MLDAFRAIFSLEPFVPHGHCYLWKTGLVGLHVSADALIALAYYSIPIALFYFVRQRQDLPFKQIFLLFAAFIISCGTTHLLEIWTLWYPMYWLSGGMKAITALVSVFTLVELLPLIPQVLALPSPTELRRLNEKLQISQARFAGILDIASDAIISIDTNQRITLFNQAAEKVFGYTANEALGQPLDLLFPQPCSISPQRSISDFMEGEHSELFGRRKDGIEFPAEASISMLQVAGEKILTAFLRDITERRNAEAKLQEQHQFLRQVIDNNPNLIFVKDWDGRFSLANQALAEVFNTTIAEIIGKTDADFCLDPTEAEHYRQADRQVIQTLQPLVNIEEIFTTSAGVRYFQSTKTPLMSADGQTRYVLGVSNDITALKRTEAALRQKTEELEAFFSSAIDLLCIANIEGYFLQLNPEWERTLGYNLHDLEGSQFLDFVHPDDLEATLTAISQLSEQQPILSFVNRYRHQNGSYRWLEWRSVPKGNYIYAAARDITDRNQAEEALRESEERFRGAFDYSAIGMALVGLDGRWLKVNRSICEIVGYSEEELSALTFQEITHPDDLKTDLACIHQLLAGDSRTYQIEKRYFHQQGQIIWALLNVSIVRNHQNKPLYFVSQIQDITNRKQMEQALRDSETRFRTLIEDLHVGVLVQGANAEMLLSNSKALELLGLTESQLLGKTSFDPDWNVTYEDGSPFPGEMHPVPQAIATGRPVHNVIMGVYRPHPNDRVWLLVDAEPQLDKAGTVQQVICTFSDISDRQAALRERERAEAELQQREREFRALVENAPDIIMRLNYECRYLYINPTVERHSGIPAAAFIGKAIEDFGAPEPLIELWRTNIHRAFETGQEQQLEFEMPTAEGIVYYATRIVPEPASDGSVQSVLAIARDISDHVRILHERERAEERLRRYERIVAATTDGISLIDRNYTYQVVNPAYLDWHEKSHDQIIGHTVSELLGTELFESQIKNRLDRCLAGEIVQDERWVEFATLEPQFVSMTYAPYVEPDHSISGVVVSSRNLTELRRAEEQFQQSEERLRLALKAAKFGTWECNLVTNKLFQSNISEIYGLEPGQTHKNQEEWQAQVHPDDRNWVQAEFDRAIREAGEFYAEFRIIHPDGSGHWALSTGAVVHDHAGQPLYAYGIAADITDRKLIEGEQKAQQAFLRQVIDMVPNIIFAKNKAGRILTVNQAGADAHGTTVETMIGKRETDFNPNFSSAQLKELLAINRQVMQTRQPHIKLSEMIVSVTGETHWYQTVINPLIDVDGQVIGVVGATTDVTTLKRIEQDLQQAKEAAEAANKAKSIFLANMSHELRTPLNVILGFVQVMYRDPQLTSEQRENLQIIRRSGNHLLSLINDVLDLSKIEAGHNFLEESNVDLTDLLRSLEQMFCQRAEAKGLQLRLELTSDVPQAITVDANKLRQVLINLLSNAIKFTKHGAVVLRVQTVRHRSDPFLTPVSSDQRQVSIRFEVIDTGVGIYFTELETIFSAFVQTQAGKTSPEGTGLGLTISRKFVQLMGGDIIVQSIPDQGSTFAFTIPVHLADSAEAAMPPCTVIGLAPNQPTYRILIVDDQLENRKLLVKLLTQIGLEVREATNGQDAIAQWQQWQPHLICMDIRMPVLSGYEATQQIRATSDGQFPIIIALTAQASKGDRTLALASGCNDYLSKPFQEEVLLRKIAEHLGIKYLCAADRATSNHQLHNASVTLHPADLSVMPSEWIVELRHAAELCDDSSIESLIEQIPTEQISLIKGLRQLVQNYSFKLIIGLTTSGAANSDA